MSEQPSGEKTEDPTPRRRQEARKKGTVAKSQELTGAVTLLAAGFVLPGVIGSFWTQFTGALNSASAAPPSDLTVPSMAGQMATLGLPLLTAVLPFFAVLMVVGLAVNFAQVGFVLSGEPMKPSLEKINPGTGFKRIFSRRGTTQGIMATAKLALFSYLAYTAIADEWPRLTGLSTLGPIGSAQVIGSVAHSLLVRIGTVWLVISVADYLFQRKEVEKQLKMTKGELKREMKEQEGSPEIKSAMYQRRRKLLKGGLASKIRTADVVVTNPTHFAVAIQYKRNSMHAPVVVAKGQDYLALKIREIATDSGIPIVENKPLARQLYKRCEAGDFVPRDLFTPVAEVLAYVYKTVKKVRSQAKPA